MLALVAAHLLVAALLPVLSARSHRTAFLVAAVLPAGALAWGLSQTRAALLLAFAGVMLGLVLADDLITLYVFWELTSVASFLLVGQGGKPGRAGGPRCRPCW
ncbi:MAG: hypothetical protein ABR608_08515 [Pseudonocardiaceae bacterium]